MDYQPNWTEASLAKRYLEVFWNLGETRPKPKSRFKFQVYFSIRKRLQARFS